MNINPSNLAKNAKEVVLAIDAGVPLGQSAGAWLRTGMTALLHGKDLREALGIKQGHGKRGESLVRLADRNNALLSLVSAIDPERKSPTETSKLVARFISGDEEAPASLAPLVCAVVEYGTVSSRTILRILSDEKRPASVVSPSVLLWRWCSK